MWKAFTDMRILIITQNHCLCPIFDTELTDHCKIIMLDDIM